MITFLPYRSFSKSAKCLDSRRLNKQILEACQILDCLSYMDDKGRVIKNGINVARCHHPITLSWIGYENALKYYINICIKERIKRKENEHHKYLVCRKPIQKPKWIGKALIRSHRSVLIDKDKYYRSFGWKDYKIQYYWPWTWSQSSNCRVHIPVNTYKKIARLPKIKYDKAIGIIKKTSVSKILKKDLELLMT